MMNISIIVAKAKNNAIGKDNQLLWHLPDDMKFFKEKTTGHHIITGRKNYFSIPEKYRPLPNRINLIVSKNMDLKVENSHVFSDIQSAISYAASKEEQELFIIGGGEIYKQTIGIATKLYVTEVNAIFSDADTFFPHIDNNIWKEVKKTHHTKDEKHLFDFDFKEYIRQ